MGMEVEINKLRMILEGLAIKKVRRKEINQGMCNRDGWINSSINSIWCEIYQSFILKRSIFCLKSLAKRITSSKIHIKIITTTIKILQ